MHLRNKWILLFFLLSSCANWELKEQCEKTNWFEHAQDVAFDGRYLEEDGFVKACKGLDLISYEQIDLGFKLGRKKMCSYDEIYNRGRTGVPVFFKFCDGLNPQKMTERFEAGLKVFCTKENGYPYGKSGKEYQKVCSPESEAQFLPTYYQGRKEYLRARIKSLDEDLKQLRRDAQLAAAREARVSIEFASLVNIQECSFLQVYDELTKMNTTRRVCHEPMRVQMQRSQLMDQLSTVRTHLGEAMAKINKAHEDKMWSQQELSKLP